MSDPSPAFLRIHDLPKGERPREKLAAGGAATLTDAELLALFFRTGIRGMSAIELGKELIRAHRSLSALSRCTPADLMATKGIGPAKASELSAAFELGKRLAKERFSDQKIDSPEAVFDILGAEMQALRQESLRVILLNTRHHIIRIQEVFIGSINSMLAHPREILRPVILHSAYGFILVHNHPSCDPSPSEADRVFTSRVRNICTELEIRFLDHVIIGLNVGAHEPYFSFRESGLL
ncbi:DNA repair protein RadC [soil metagenome]